MSQEDMQRYLRKYQSRWFSSTQLGEVLGVSKASMKRCLRRMRKHNEVNEKMIRVMLRGKLGFISKEVPFYSFKKL